MQTTKVHALLHFRDAGNAGYRDLTGTKLVQHEAVDQFEGEENVHDDATGEAR